MRGKIIVHSNSHSSWDPWVAVTNSESLKWKLSLCWSNGVSWGWRDVSVVKSVVLPEDLGSSPISTW